MLAIGPNIRRRKTNLNSFKTALLNSSVTIASHKPNTYKLACRHWASGPEPYPPPIHSHHHRARIAHPGAGSAKRKTEAISHQRPWLAAAAGLFPPDAGRASPRAQFTNAAPVLRCSDPAALRTGRVPSPNTTRVSWGAFLAAT